jgi:hypothetical protein
MTDFRAPRCSRNDDRARPISADPALAAQVEGVYSALPGATIPNYTVGPPVGLTIMQNSRIVTQPTTLQRLIGPNMRRVDCAFCLE